MNNEIKVNLSIILPGSIMFSKEECLKTLQKTVVKKSKTGKIYKKIITVKEPDYDKLEKHTFRTTEYVEGKNILKAMTFYTPKTKSATQSLNISYESYQYMISNECPYWSKPRVWNSLPKKERLEAHLQRICEHFHGISFTYKVMDD